MVRLFASSVNELLATALLPEPPHMNIFSAQSPELTYFMYSILYFLLKFTTTNSVLLAQLNYIYI